jgi:hypothetical protein
MYFVLAVGDCDVHVQILTCLALTHFGLQTIRASWGGGFLLHSSRKVKVTQKLICKSPSNPNDLRLMESSQTSQ